ncbi:MAG: glycosyltransferase 87 family protein [Dehalococcoidia bacterium]
MPPPHSNPARPSSRWQLGRLDRLLLLVICGLGLALVFVYGLLLPLDHSRHPGVVFGYQPLATVFGTDREGQTRFVAAVLAAYLMFSLAAIVARRLAGRRACAVVLGGTVALALVLLPTNPAGAQDIYHNIADARTLWIYGDNPAVTPPSQHPDDPLFRFIPAWPDTPSSYGPLWYVLSGVPLPLAGDDLWSNVLGQKLLTAAFLVATTVLVMLTAARMRPGSAALAGVLVGWNPLLQFETAGAAHNDIVMVCFAIGAFYALTRRAWDLAFPLLALAVAVKYVLILLAPLFLGWMLLRRDVPRLRLARSVLAGLVLVSAWYVPFLSGGNLLDTLRGEGNRYLSSVGSVLVSLFMNEGGRSVTEAETVMKRVLWVVFVLGSLLLTARARPRPSYALLTTTSAAMVFLFLVTVKWWFWPWYLTWLVPLAALTPRRGIAALAVLFSCTAMLLYAAYYWNVYEDWHRQQRLVFWIVFAAPLGLAALLSIWAVARAALTLRRRFRRQSLAPADGIRP